MSEQTPAKKTKRGWDWTVWFTIVAAIAFIWSVSRTCAPADGYFDRDFDAEAWRAEPDNRAAMSEELIEHIEATDYSRRELTALLGSSANERPDEIVWSMGECGHGMPTYCWLHVEFTDEGKVARVYETRD